MQTSLLIVPILLGQAEPEWSVGLVQVVAFWFGMWLFGQTLKYSGWDGLVKPRGVS